MPRILKQAQAEQNLQALRGYYGERAETTILGALYDAPVLGADFERKKLRGGRAHPRLNNNSNRGFSYVQHKVYCK